MLRRAVPWLFVAAALTALTWAIWRDWNDVKSGLAGADTRGIAISAGFAALTAVCNFALWRSISRGMSIDLPQRQAGRMYFVSQLGKYLPGAIWPMAAQLEYSGRHGINRQRVLATNLLTIAMGLSSGLSIGIPLLLVTGSLSTINTAWLAGVAIIVLALSQPRNVLRMLNAGLTRFGRNTVNVPSDRRRWLTVGWWWALLAWLSLGIHIWLLFASLDIADQPTLLIVLVAVTISTCVGILAVPFPAGIGVREGLFISIMVASVDSATALIVAVLSRLVLTLVDVTAAGLSTAVRVQR